MQGTEAPHPIFDVPQGHLHPAQGARSRRDAGAGDLACDDVDMSRGGRHHRAVDGESAVGWPEALSEVLPLDGAPVVQLGQLGASTGDASLACSERDLNSTSSVSSLTSPSSHHSATPLTATVPADPPFGRIVFWHW